MAKLQISEIALRNFRSFGNYDTIVKLQDLGPVLITGTNEDNPDKANGTGKTTLAESIIWALFGRLPGNRPAQVAPGDWIINDKIGKDCSVTLKTVNGYTIKRTRKLNGHNDLIIIDPDGQNISDSTNRNAQQHLKQLFNLDYDIFMSGTFFAQASVPFLEMPDQKRKKTIERMLNLTRFDKYVEVAKEKADLIEKQQIKINADATNIELQIMSISKQLESANSLFEDYERQRQDRIIKVSQKRLELNAKYENLRKEIEQTILHLSNEINNSKTYDCDKLKLEWEEYEREHKSLLTIIQNLQSDINKVQSEIKILGQQSYDESQHTNETTTIKSNITKLQETCSKLTIYDIDSIQIQWEKYNREYSNITEEISKREIDLAKLIGNKDASESEAKKVENKINTICPECLQQVSEQHVHKIKSIIITRTTKMANEIEQLEKKIEDLRLKKNQLKKPTLSVSEANTKNALRQSKESEIGSWQQSLRKLDQKHSDNLALVMNNQNKIKSSELLLRTKSLDLQIKSKTMEVLKDKAPKVLLNEAVLLNERYNERIKSIEECKKRIVNLSNDKKEEEKQINFEITDISNEINPYAIIIQNHKEELDSVQERKQEIKMKISNFNKLIGHIDYIRQAYSDRRKIRSFVMSKLVPYFNERIAYYLSIFDCTFKIEFNSFLQTQSDKWPYELWSGGQKRRIDLAIMLAIHDLHESIYDRQCNILVFDEYDRSLDTSGIYSFVNLIFKDFSKKDQTILVISHNHNMLDMFPTKLQVKMQNGFSRISDA